MGDTVAHLAGTDDPDRRDLRRVGKQRSGSKRMA